MIISQNSIPDSNSNDMGKNRLSDRDILFDLLLTEKHMSYMYEHATTTSSTTDIFNLFQQLQQDEHETIHKLSAIMQEHGWTSQSDAVEKSRMRRTSRLSRSSNSSNSNYAVTSSSQQFGSALQPNNDGREAKRSNNSSSFRSNRNSLTYT